MSPPAIAKSAKYPRVAVLLGVSQKWYIPLLLCRSLSTVFALWWAVSTTRNIYIVVDAWDDMTWGGQGEGDVLFRLTVAQLGLAYLWACTTAYLSHLFAASLMSRWLQHYSPLAVLVRLCALSVILSYFLMQVFMYTGTTTVDRDRSMVGNLECLANGLPVWVCIHVTLLLGYFSTQHDISVDGDKDDRRRRLVLRMKCLTTLAMTSTASLMILLAVMRFNERDKGMTVSDPVSRMRRVMTNVLESLSRSDREL